MRNKKANFTGIKIMVLLCAAMAVLAMTGCTREVKAQDVPGGKNIRKLLTKGDSLLTAYVQGEEGFYKTWRATLKNPHATIIDTVYLNHISRDYGTGLLSDTTRIGWKKLNPIAGYNGPQNDTIYNVVYLQPGEELEVLVWFPYPDRLQWVMANYTTGAKLAIKNRPFVE